VIDAEELKQSVIETASAIQQSVIDQAIDQCRDRLIKHFEVQWYQTVTFESVQ